MSITAKELDALISAAHERSEYPDLTDEEQEQYGAFFDYGNVWSAFKYEDYYPVKLSDDVFVVETVDEYGGEGQGEEFWVVVRVQTPDGSQLFRKAGYYASYVGGELDGPTEEVEAYQVAVTKFRRVK